MCADLSTVDHLVYAVPDLDTAIDRIERLSGIRASTGGSHPGMGTRNALISLGATTYLEIVGPDPAQTGYRSPRVFRIDELDSPRLVTWAAKAEDIGQIAAIVFESGDMLGQPMAGSRKTPDGVTLAWQLTDPYTQRAGGVVPFFIDWGDTAHPATGAAPGATLADFRALHPDPGRVQQMFEALGLDVGVAEGSEPALIAVMDTPNGRVELR